MSSPPDGGVTWSRHLPPSEHPQILHLSRVATERADDQQGAETACRFFKVTQWGEGTAPPPTVLPFQGLGSTHGHLPGTG